MSVIEQNSVVYLTYELRIDDPEGDLVEKVENTQPFVFLYGMGNLLPEFESNLGGLKAGESFEFSIQSDNAYGPVNANAIVDLPKSSFENDGVFMSDMVEVGKYVPMRDQEGNAIKGLVVEITDDNVKMDFNHPLAGRDLYFKGDVENVRAATAEEIDHGHVHGDGGVHH